MYDGEKVVNDIRDLRTKSGERLNFLKGHSKIPN